MLSRSNIAFLVIFGLAVVATILLFTAGPWLTQESAPSGRLSPEVIDTESQFQAIQAEWNANEKAFLEANPQISLKLTGLKERLQKLEIKAAALQGRGDAESAALPHLVGSIKAMHRMSATYVMRLLAPKRVGQADWDKMKQDTRESNSEWEAWKKATANMTR